jgi:hypothetical protein
MTANRYILFKIIFPLTIISLFFVTKWWFALPIDGIDKMYWGFPLAFMGEGFHTSMSYQFFMLEFFIDFFIYFIFWTVLLFSFQKIFPIFHIKRIFTNAIWVVALLFSVVFSTYISSSNPVFHSKRGYDWQIMKTGYVFIWQVTPSPDIMKYHPSLNKESKNPNSQKQ